MRKRFGLAAGIALWVALGWPADARAMFGMQDFDGMVAYADAVVRAKVLKDEDHYTAEPHGRVATLEVEKVLIGKCDRQIRVLHSDINPNEEKGYAPGEVYYLCLVPASLTHDKLPPAAEGMYNEVNYSHTKIPVKDDKVELPEELRVPDYVKPILADLSVKQFEAVLLWLRGPSLEAKPAKEVFQCDEPLELEVALTNTSPLPMRLMCGSPESFRAFFNAKLRDSIGFPVAFYASGADNPDGSSLYSAKDMEVSRLLAPGESLKGKVRFDIRLEEYWQDPQRTCSLALDYHGDNVRGDAVKDGWRGGQYVRIPVRIACPYRSWAESLRRPNSQWGVSVCVITGHWNDSATVIVSPKQGVWVTVLINSPDPADLAFDRRAGGEGSTGQTLSVAEQKALASCIRVERGGKVVAGPAFDEAALQALLSRFKKDAPNALRGTNTGFSCPLNLAEHFDLTTPGDYRIRLTLPDPKEPSLSNVVILTVPAAGK